MKRSLFALALLFMYSALVAQDTAATLPRLEKKIIEYGWDVPTADYVSKNIEAMEKHPFDGIIFKLSSYGRVLVPEVLDQAKLAKEYEACKSIKWNKFKHNFVILWAASEQDWFDDAQWELILKKTAAMTHAAKLAGCVGICFDEEPYGFNPWSYKIAKHCKTKSFAEYEAQVRKRGAQFIKAVESEMPGLRILTFFQLSYLRTLLQNMDPTERQAKLEGQYYGLSAAFLNGMLDAGTPEMRIIDGNESAYYYTDSEAYFRSYHSIRQTAKLLVDKCNLEKYNTQVQVGQALYIDQYYGLRKLKVLGAYLNPQEQAKWFEHNIYWALKTTEEYVWCYSERMNWWQGKIPAGAPEAIVSAKAKVLADKPLGINMKEIVAAGTANQKKEMAAKLKIRSCEVHQLPATVVPPVVDGKLDDAAWKNATKLELNPLAGFGDAKLVAPGSVLVTYDANALYYAFRCQEPNMGRLTTHAQRRDDDAIWLGDEVELMLSTVSGKTCPFFHLIHAPNGQVWDARHVPDVDTSVNLEWKYAQVKGEKEWMTEVAIPWKSLGISMPAPGTTLRGNFCRQRQAGVNELSAWSSQATGFLEDEFFGYIKFVGK